MAENMDTHPSIPDFAAQIAALTAHVQENANRFLALEDENATLRRENAISPNGSPLWRLLLIWIYDSKCQSLICNH